MSALLVHDPHGVGVGCYVSVVAQQQDLLSTL